LTSLFFGIHHLIIGLNRENVETILQDNVLTLPAGFLTGLTEESDMTLLFAETDEELERRFPRNVRPPTAAELRLNPD
jgi:hypothetical protein